MLNVPVNGNKIDLLGNKLLYQHDAKTMASVAFVCIVGFFILFMMAVIINDNTSNQAVLAIMWSVFGATFIALIIGFAILCFAYCPTKDDMKQHF